MELPIGSLHDYPLSDCRLDLGVPGVVDRGGGFVYDDDLGVLE